ncbi:MAG TPA: MFS transporter [Steroidobacteraceae bacterium]|nr:MFS transporter [Steroidobacteraceae bacterium]
MLQLLRHHDARLLLAGQTLSMFSDSAMYLVLGVWVKALTGSNAAAGLVFFALAIPSLAGPIAGLLVDRVRRRPLMIVADCFIGAAVLSLLLVRGSGQLWLIYLVTILYGASASVFVSAQSALLTVLLPDELLGDANAAFQTVRQGLRLVAPLAGAGLFAAFGGGAVAALDAASFVASALCLAALRTHEGAPAPQIGRFREDVSAGIQHILHTLPLRQIVFAVGVALLVVGFTETLIFAVVDEGLHRAPSFLGVLTVFQGVGAIAGGLTAGRAVRRLGDGRVTGLGLFLFAAGDALLIAPSLPLVIGGFVVAGAGLSWAIVGFGTAIQRRSPAHLQGRVYSAANTITGTPQTISIALGAALATFFSYQLLLAVMAVVTAACGIYLVSRGTFRDLPAGETQDGAVNLLSG